MDERVRIVSTALLAALVVGCPRSATVPLPPRPGRPAPLVVTLVVDQLAAWMATTRLPELPATGGFARLRREGTWARDVRYLHAVTDTAPGHASLYTGLPPCMSGI